MKRIALLGLAIAAIGLTACSKQETATVPYQPNWQQIHIDTIKRPKHYRMTYTVVKTGEILGVSSKHCNDWDRVKVGNVYTADINQTGCGLVRSIP